MVGAVLLSGWAGAAWVQADDGSSLLDRSLPAVFRDADPAPTPPDVATPLFFADPEPEAAAEPGSLWKAVRFRPAEREGALSLGGQWGYLKARGAERGTAYGGIQGRIQLIDHVSGEASIGIHASEFARGDLKVLQLPVQLTAYYYPITEGPFLPYVQAGLGWYYTKVEYRGSLAAVPDRPENIFGQHAGVGIEFRLGPRVAADVSFKYVIQQPDIRSLGARDLDYWQFTAGLSWSF